MATRPTIFKWRQTEPALILCTVRRYLRYSLSLRDVEELLEERGLEADHTTVWRWVQRYGPELEQRLRRYLKPTNKSWRVDETYVRGKTRRLTVRAANRRVYTYAKKKILLTTGWARSSGSPNGSGRPIRQLTGPAPLRGEALRSQAAR